jgi:hypothetical protein
MCNECQSGTFQSNNGSAACTPCPYDFTLLEKKRLFFKDCRSCFNETSSDASEMSCCNATEVQSVPLNVSSARSDGSSPGILMIADIQDILNAALASKGIINLIALEQDAIAWSFADASGKAVTLRLRYGGFQLRFDSTYYFREFLGFHDPVPAQGPTRCSNKSEIPSFQEGCMPCKSDFSLVAPEIALSLRSR